MDRLLVAALVLLAAACKEAADRKPAAGPTAAAPAAGLALADLERLLPDTLAGLPRRLVTPLPEINQVEAYYQDQGNTRSGHVTYTLLSSPPRTLAGYQKRYPERAQVGGRTAYVRQHQPKTQPETAEGCLVLAERVGVCVDIAPGAIADLPALFEALPLAELERRAAAR